ncbi:hypothetical protein [Pelosinus fermentans]|nr:hypothetical protein [Pelosinus fermentans]
MNDGIVAKDQLESCFSMGIVICGDEQFVCFGRGKAVTGKGVFERCI